MLLIPTAVSILGMTAFGGTAIWQIINLGTDPVAAIVAAYVPELSLFVMLETLPLNAITSFVGITLVIVVKGHVRGTLEAPHRAIRAVADEIGAHLIVLGARNPRLDEYLTGSTASQVTLYAKCSVYVVRRAAAVCPGRGQLSAAGAKQETPVI